MYNHSHTERRKLLQNHDNRLLPRSQTWHAIETYIYLLFWKANCPWKTIINTLAIKKSHRVPNISEAETRNYPKKIKKKISKEIYEYPVENSVYSAEVRMQGKVFREKN